RGPPERELAKLAGEVGAESLHFTRDVTPFARARGERVRAALAQSDVRICGHPGLSAVEDLGALRTQAGGAYTIFTPFHRAWEREPRREVLGAPRELPALPSRLAKGRIPSLGSLGLAPEGREPPGGGEPQARQRLARFLKDHVQGYGQGRDALGEQT